MDGWIVDYSRCDFLSYHKEKAVGGTAALRVLNAYALSVCGREHMSIY